MTEDFDEQQAIVPQWSNHASAEPGGRSALATTSCQAGEWFGAMIDASPLATYVVGRDGVVLIWNPAAERMFGWSALETIGGAVPNLADDSRPRFERLLGAAFDGSAFRGEGLRPIRKDGRTIDVRLSMAALTESNGHTTAVIVTAEDVSERVTAVRHSAEVESKFAALADAAADAIVTSDARGVIAFWNRSAESMFGYRQDEIVGRPLTTILPERLGSGEGPALDRAASTEQTLRASTTEMWAVRRDGTAFPIELSLSSWPSTSGVFHGAIIRDVTERKRSDDVLRDRVALEHLVASTSAHFTALAGEAIDDGIHAGLEAVGTFFGLDRGFVYLFEDGSTARRSHGWLAANDAARIIGVENLAIEDQEPSLARLLRRETVRISVSDVEPPELEPARESLRAKGIKTLLAVPVAIESTLLGFLGFSSIREERQWTEPDIGVVRLVGEIVAGALARKRADAELRRLNEELAERVRDRTSELSRANAELARAARLKDEFLASMSHELRTPLNAVLGLSEALNEGVYGPLNGQQQNALRNVEESGRHLLALINDILDLSKIEAGKLTLELASVRVEQVCQSSLRLVREDARKKHLNLECTVDPAVTFLRADERRLKQMLVNLLSNAVKFTPDGGSVGLVVAGDRAAGSVHMTVWDTGVGIAKEDVDKLFKPFVQLDSRLAREHAGTGLGLALVQRMARMHAGSVAIESELGVGSRFTISLPWFTSRSSRRGTHSDESNSEAPASFPRRALVVDDSTVAITHIERYLSEARVASVAHTRAADVVERALDTRPDVIFLDILMPDGSGWDVISELKGDVRTKDIPVVVVSITDDRANALAAGAVDAIVKPVSRDRLATALRRVAAHPRPTGASHRTAERDASAVILLAEDNEVNVATVIAFLERRGYRIIVAGDGETAVQRAIDDSPDLILMDVQMPGMDGLEATRRIRAHASTSSIPIVALTALAMPGDREKCIDAGVDEYLSKPVQFKQLFATIETCLDRGAGRAS